MGLLDDAIREHLELKRKHGAAEEEVQRQESEALGPARRDFAPEEPGAAAEPEEEVAPPPEPVVAEPATWLDEEDEDAAPPDEPAPEPIEHAAEAADPALLQEPVAAPDPAPAAVPEAPVSRRESDTPTQGFDALSRDELEDEGEGDEDVLEETPDFLQDTPEHDRLWFEQKPPRDFDFDD